jgi:hypothetical protein
VATARGQALSSHTTRSVRDGAHGEGCDARAVRIVTRLVILNGCSSARAHMARVAPGVLANRLVLSQ